MRIGFIGLGTMGGAASLNLIRGGHQLTVCDLDLKRATKHLELGAKWAYASASHQVGGAFALAILIIPKCRIRSLEGAKPPAVSCRRSFVGTIHPRMD